jgi:hypothetical protein
MGELFEDSINTESVDGHESVINPEISDLPVRSRSGAADFNAT